MPTAYAYIRFSTPQQAQGDSYRRQIALCRRYASANNLLFDETLNYEDLGVSAFHGQNMDTGELGAFVEAVREGTVSKGSFLLVENIDRISRSGPSSVIQLLIELFNYQITVVTLQDNRSLTTLNDLTQLLIIAVGSSLGNEESKKKSERLRAVWENKRQNAKQQPMTGLVPSWLDYDRNTGTIKKNLKKSRTIRKIYDLYIGGDSYSKIAKHLNEQAVPTFGHFKQYEWTLNFVQTLITDRRLLGEIQPREYVYENGVLEKKPSGQVVEGYYPKVIPERVFYEAQKERLSRIKSPRKNRYIHANMFLGLASCSSCGHNMYVKGGFKDKYKTHFYLHCPNASFHNKCSNLSRWPIKAVEFAFSSGLLAIESEKIAQARSGFHLKQAADLKEEVLRLKTNLGILEEQKSNLLCYVREYGVDSMVEGEMKQLQPQIELLQNQVGIAKNDLMNSEAAVKNASAILEDKFALIREWNAGSLDDHHRILVNKILKELVVSVRLGRSPEGLGRIQVDMKQPNFDWRMNFGPLHRYDGKLLRKGYLISFILEGQERGELRSSIAWCYGTAWPPERYLTARPQKGMIPLFRAT